MIRPYNRTSTRGSYGDGALASVKAVDSDVTLLRASKTLTAVNFARDHGIHLLTLPPHSTHKMQPLDRSYFKALKCAYNAAAGSWMVAIPGRQIIAYEMAAFFGKAFTRTATPDKVVRGLLCQLWALAA